MNQIALIGGALALVIALITGVWLSNSWWAPRLDHTINKLLKSEDQGASDKIAKDGADATVVTIDKQAKQTAQIQARTNYVTTSLRASASATTPLPRADVDRLYAADVELCQLGVVCSSDTGAGDDARGPPTPTPVTPKRAGSVPIIRPTEKGNTSLK